MASLSVRGLVPISAAIAGSDVAITVESMFSMNRAVATISGIRRSFFMEIRGRDGLRPEHGLYHPLAVQAIADPSEAPKSDWRHHCCSRLEIPDDLRPCCASTSAWAAPEWATILRDCQSGPDRHL